jgi:DNA modification methylase
MEGTLLELEAGTPHIGNLRIGTLTSVTNPNSIHGIYPYRGKISALDASSVVRQLKPGLLLDPFCGTGTILYEANRAGLDAIGVDSNPLAYWIAKGKLDSSSLQKERYIAETQKLISNVRKSTAPNSSPLLKKAFHRKTLLEIQSIIRDFDRMSDYVRACFLGAIALTARGCNGYKWTSSSVGKDIYPKQYINFYEKFLGKVRKHIYEIDINKKSQVFLHDSRKLGDILPANSVDHVFTSPPYFDALDYTAYYGQIAYELLKINRVDVKKDLIQNAKTYREDMQTVLNELVRVTKKDSLIIFVVGDKKTNKGEVVNGGEFFSNLLHHAPTTVIERQYTGSSSQIFDKLNKTARKEQIVIWDKNTWK